MAVHIDKYNGFEHVAHEDVKGVYACGILKGPGKWDAARSALDGLLVELTLELRNVPRQRVNVRFRVAGSTSANSGFISFEADVYKVTQRTLRSRLEAKKRGRFNGYYRVIGGDRLGSAHVDKDLLELLEGSDYNESLWMRDLHDEIYR